MRDVSLNYKEVALRKESVDRNVDPDSDTLTDDVVALRKESVDRNSTYVTRLPRVQVSLSARRAWIEIPQCLISPEGRVLSLSARRAWIEIIVCRRC